MPSRLKTGSKVAIAAVACVSAFEGLRTIAYRDPVGIPTICFGETRGVRMGDVKTADDCRTMLGHRLLEFESGVRKCLKNPDAVPDGAYVAILSFSYNVGVGAFCKSTMRAKIDAGDITGACEELTRYVWAMHIKLPGLVARRRTERDICREKVL